MGLRVGRIGGLIASIYANAIEPALWASLFIVLLLPNLQRLERSMYGGMQVETGTRVAGAYDVLLAYATNGVRFDPAGKLDMMLLTADLSGVHSLGALSRKYYGDAKYWRLIPWVNPAEFPINVDENTDPATARPPLYIVQFLH